MFFRLCQFRPIAGARQRHNGIGQQTSAGVQEMDERLGSSGCPIRPIPEVNLGGRTEVKSDAEWESLGTFVGCQRHFDVVGFELEPDPMFAAQPEQHN